MTTIILSAAASSLGQTAFTQALLGGVGGLIGGFIDRQLGIFGSSGGGTRPEEITGRNEGDAIAWCCGSQCMVPGGILWASPIRKNTSGGGFLQGPESDVYRADVAILFTRHATNSMLRLFAAGDVLYNADVNVNLSGTVVSIAPFTIVTYPQGPSGPADTRYYRDLSSTNSTVDFSLLKVGKNATIAGFANSVNNGSEEVIQAYRNADGTSFARIRGAASGTFIPIVEAAGPTITVTQNLPEFSTSRVSSITYFPGDDDQLPSSVIEAIEGTGNVPGYRGSSYVMLQNLNLSKWGGTVPEFKALIEEASSRTLDEVVSAICLRNRRLTAGDLDVTALAGIPVLGITALGPTTALELLAQLSMVYDFDVQDRNGKLVFYLTSVPDEIIIPARFVNAVEYGTQPSTRMRRKKSPRGRLAKNVNVEFNDPARDWQPNSTTWLWKPEVVNTTQQTKLNMTLTGEEGAKVAQKLGMRIALEIEEATVTLPPNCVEVCEGDNLIIQELDTDDDPQRYRVKIVDRGDNGLIEAVCSPEDLESYEQEAESENPSPVNPPTGSVTVPGSLDRLIVDLPPLTDSDARRVGIYIGAGTADPTKNFNTGTAFRSLDEGSTFIAWQAITQGSVTGVVSGTLSANGSAYYVDTTNTLTVVLHHGTYTFSNADIYSVVEGANWLLVGREIIGFTTATLIGTRTWRLSGLVRGLAGTDDQITTHVASEAFLVIDLDALKFKEIGNSEIGQVFTARIVPAGGLVSDYPNISVTASGRSAQPLDPYGIRGTRNAALDITLSWFPRSRGSYNVFGSSTPPLLDTIEKYKVEILNIPETQVKRTITVTGSPSVVYTAAQQVQDFLATVSSLHVRIHQVGEFISVGRKTTAVV